MLLCQGRLDAREQLEQVGEAGIAVQKELSELFGELLGRRRPQIRHMRTVGFRMSSRPSSFVQIKILNLPSVVVAAFCAALVVTPKDR